MEFEISDQVDANGVVVDKNIKITTEEIKKDISIFSLTELKAKQKNIDAEIQKLQKQLDDLNLIIEACK